MTISFDQAHERFAVGARVLHLHREWRGTVAVRPKYMLQPGQVYESLSGRCVSINIEWDHGEHLWTSPDQLMRIEDEDTPDAMRPFDDGLSEIGGMRASSAMGLACRGDLDRLRVALATLPTEQVQEIAAAAALLISTAHEVAGSTPEAIAECDPAQVVRSQDGPRDSSHEPLFNEKQRELLHRMSIDPTAGWTLDDIRSLME
ncbi:hypothetical protein IL992_43935 [Microbispora sp. NEAU-D428]|uniref:hypothetical protein n=1 Tax=Microbispora sitophila TaxID=2771537 RepID=UPI0018696457|nr:hypothetical protein [Microbispora sitophila]MBE3016055.1 hypothetical protein [Microbispora sitophila]